MIGPDIERVEGPLTVVADLVDRRRDDHAPRTVQQNWLLLHKGLIVILAKRSGMDSGTIVSIHESINRSALVTMKPGAVGPKRDEEPIGYVIVLPNSHNFPIRVALRLVNINAAETTRSRRRFSLEASKSPLAFLVINDRVKNFLSPEIGKEHGCDIDLTIGELPEEEV